MELRVYDSNLDFVGLSEDQTSLIWTRKYYEPGDFKATLPLTQRNYDLYKMERLVSFIGAREAGVIEDIDIHETAAGRTLTASGRFLSSYMDRRLIRPTVNFNGFTEVAMMSLLAGAYPLPKVELGGLNGFTESVRFQATYRNLLDYEIKLSKSSGIGFRFRPDFDEKKIYFETYKGLDRTRYQAERAFVEFSDKFDNLNSATWRQNSTLLRNVGYVGGQGEGEDRVFVTIGNDSLSGLERREVFIDARDLSPEELTDAEYEEVLAERGAEKMASEILSSSFECETNPDCNFKYRSSYDLGDIVTVRKTGWGIDLRERITEISEVYEHGIATIVPTLGDAIPTTIDWEGGY